MEFCSMSIREKTKNIQYIPESVKRTVVTVIYDSKRCAK